MSAQPFSSVEWMIAGRYLRAKKKESFVSVVAGFSFVGIALGVAVLIIVMSVMNGFRKELLSRILGVNGHMVVESLSGGIENYDAVAAAIRAVPGVTAAIPKIEKQVLAIANDIRLGALVRGVAGESLQALPWVAATLGAEDLARFEGASVILGYGLSRALGVRQGMRVRLLSPDGEVTVMGRTPRSKAFTVAGVFQSGYGPIDNLLVFMPLAEAQGFFNAPGRVGAIDVTVADPTAVDAATAPVLAAAPPGLVAGTWMRDNRELVGALIVERNVMFLILTLIILIAALNTISGLIMLVKDKGRDIAILRTMGMTSGGIMRVFFLAGSAIGLAGTVLGVVLGILFCLNIETIRQFLDLLLGFDLFPQEIYFLATMPSEMDPGEITAVVIMSMTVAFLATLYPAWRAARLDPVEALRYE